MATTTIIMPISRLDNLDQIFARLELLECDKKNTFLVCPIDGDNKLFVEARNKVVQSKFERRLAYQFQSKHKKRNYDYIGRRKRISDIHNSIKEHVVDSEFVFGIEDDTLIKPSSLKILLKDYSFFPDAGLIQGVQLGRWGNPHVGAWNVLDDIYEPTEIESVMPPENENSHVEEIDAGGFYCFLTKAYTYINHDFKPFQHLGLGPDVDYGISLRQMGMLNYIDWRVTTAHKVKTKRMTKEISLKNTEPRQVKFIKKENRWRQVRI